MNVQHTTLEKGSRRKQEMFDRCTSNALRLLALIAIKSDSDMFVCIHVRVRDQRQVVLISIIMMSSSS